MKRCPACRCDKLESEFSRDRSKRDGLRSSCKICSNTRFRNWRLKNAESLKLLERDGVANCNRMETKRCSVCKCDKKVFEFNRDCGARDGLQSYCRICTRSRSKKHSSENPDESRRRSYKRNYGLSLEQYDQMLLEQGGVCAICNQPELKRSLSVDHDHATGEVRALLCDRCNQGLGRFLDRAYLIDKAAIYLRRFKPVYEG